MYLFDFIVLKYVFFIQAFEWSEQSEVATVHTLDQRYILCADYDRDMVLIEALRKYREENETANVMIFTNTKKYVNILISICVKNDFVHGYNFHLFLLDAVSCYR